MNTIIRLVLSAIAVVACAYLLPGVHVGGNFIAPLAVALVLVVLNFLVRPILTILTLPITVLTLGLFLFVINALIVLIADWLLGSAFGVDDFWWALIFSFVYSLFNTVIDRLIGSKN
ncbi:MAG: phage holin family protein [Bernardetiaceae bacterium]|nr:phage holin family protein [Bernardetiaceae bacterium]